MNRRGFLSFLGVAPVAAASLAEIKPEPQPEPVRFLTVTEDSPDAKEQVFVAVVCDSTRDLSYD